ncbi:MAG: multidrug DMT transporter permease [Thermoanaerobaculia bacterium]
MPTKWMMSAIAVAMGLAGLAATFLPEEIVAWSGRTSDGTGDAIATLLVQVAGGLYLGFAMLNWSVREMVVGGIYNRPVVLGNLLHLTVVGLTLLRTVAAGERRPAWIAASLLYLIFGVWFARVLVSSPASHTSARSG